MCIRDSSNVSDFTNDSGYITSVPAQSFASLTGKPTTIAGYGITDAFDGAYSSLTGTPTIPSNTSDLTNNSGYITSVTGNLTATNQLTVGGAIHRNWSATDSDIDGIIGGSTFGNIIEGQSNAHFILGIRENDSNDALRIISGGGNYNTDQTYDTVIASFMCGGNVGIGTTTPTQKLEVNGTIKATAINVNGTALASSATTDTTDASNISSGILNANRLPDLTVSEYAKHLSLIHI